MNAENLRLLRRYKMICRNKGLTRKEHQGGTGGFAVVRPVRGTTIKG
ncbi:MAG: hypothetical protein MJA31_20530 [Clostridia bacterium]|nr:hypothetical protein [Clostridia bacterium]